MAYTLIILTMVRMILAAAIPPGNDEVYYWDWGRDLKWSYFDHPPGVSWLAAGSSAIFPADFFGTRLSLAVRGLTPLVHLCASLLLYSIYKRIAAGRRSRKSDLAFIAMSQLTPAFGLGGFFLLPDT